MSAEGYIRSSVIDLNFPSDISMGSRLNLSVFDANFPRAISLYGFNAAYMPSAPTVVAGSQTKIEFFDGSSSSVLLAFDVTPGGLATPSSIHWIMRNSYLRISEGLEVLVSHSGGGSDTGVYLFLSVLYQ